MDTKEKKEHNESREIREIFAKRLSRKRRKKRDNASCSEKSKTKNFSRRFFSPEDRSRVLSSQLRLGDTNLI